MKSWKITSHEVYATNKFYSRFLSSLSEGVARVVICSPAFDTLPKPFNDIIGFCHFLQQRDVEKVVIITRPPSCDAAALPQEAARFLDSKGIDIVIRTTPKLNAKLYHLEFKKGWFRSFVGSADFTFSGLETNQEVVAEVEGVGSLAPCQREISKLVSDNDAMSFPIWIHRRQPARAERTI